jgi:hypothetical protein
MRTFLQQHGRNAKPQVWHIETIGNTVRTVWGQLDGALQETIQRFSGVNKGKSNEKSPEQVAVDFLDRTIKKKIREGYYEIDGAGNPLVDVSSSTIDFLRLPENLRFFKPQNSLNIYCEKLIESGAALLPRKRDGMMHVISVDGEGNPRIYGSNMLINHKDEPGIPWMDRYPHLERDLINLRLPPNTILLGEMVRGHVTDDYGMQKDDFTYVGQVVKSLTPRALELQKNQGPLHYCIWDIAFWSGECWLHSMPAHQRFRTIDALAHTGSESHITTPEMTVLDQVNKQIIIRSVKLENALVVNALDWMGEERTFSMQKALLNWAKHMKWEGYVVVDPNAVYGDKAFNFHGKAERPKEICKMKPTLEGDFIARWNPNEGIGSYGKGKKEGGVGAVMLYLWDPTKNVEVPVCECGGGLTDKQVAEFANPKRYPRVWKVEFSEWSPKGALRFPVFLYEREDKGVLECCIDQRPSLSSEEE